MTYEGHKHVIFKVGLTEDIFGRQYKVTQDCIGLLGRAGKSAHVWILGYRHRGYIFPLFLFFFDWSVWSFVLVGGCRFAIADVKACVTTDGEAQDTPPPI